MIKIWDERCEESFIKKILCKSCGNEINKDKNDYAWINFILTSKKTYIVLYPYRYQYNFVSFLEMKTYNHISVKKPSTLNIFMI